MTTGQARFARVPFLWRLRGRCFGGLFVSSRASRASPAAGGLSASCKHPCVIPIDERFVRPSVMGVVNVTPDSFSDGGVNFDSGAAAAAARRMVDEGAAIVDLG